MNIQQSMVPQNVQNIQNPSQQQIPMLAPQGQIQQSQAEKIDNISKVKSLIIPLKESLSMTLKSSAQLLQKYNNMSDVGNLKSPDESNTPRFDKHLEEFYSICDQIELHLKTAKYCIQQGQSSTHYLPLPVAPMRLEVNPQEQSLSYPQYLELVRSQITYAKEINDTLIMAAQNICAIPD